MLSFLSVLATDTMNGEREEPGVGEHKPVVGIEKPREGPGV